MSPYDLADQINAIPAGKCLTIDRQVLKTLPSHSLEGWTGWEWTLQNVIGSSHKEMWDFNTDPLTGNITVYRRE